MPRVRSRVGRPGAFGRAILVETVGGERAGALAVIKAICLTGMTPEAQQEARKEVEV